MQVTIIILCIIGRRGLAYLPFKTDEYENYFDQKRIQIGIFTFILGTAISNGLSATGAFEIFCNSTEIFSKLKTGTVPGIEILLQKIQEQGLTLIKH